MIKHINYLIIFFLLTLVIPIKFANAEIIETQKEEKIFGQWRTLCERDIMMDSVECKISAKFYDQTSLISFDPSLTLINQLVIVIPLVELGSFVQARIDKNNLIVSDIIEQNSFGMVSFTASDKEKLIKQMKSGEFLYLRFRSRETGSDVTARLDLRDFRKSIEYYNSNYS